MSSFLLIYLFLLTVSFGQKVNLDLRERYKEGDDYHIRVRDEVWDTNKTAVIICDVWDSHHCFRAVKRVEELAPKINKFVKVMRDQGSTIIHAPSSCMDFYKNDPARKRVFNIPQSNSPPKGIDEWLNWIDDEEKNAGYPIDHSDGGEDDDPDEHAKWEKELIKMGRNHRAPWRRQIESIQIDQKVDYITDSGIENWNILENHEIENVILVGVHTNMCVLGRPFGLRQLAKNGKNVVLARDLTDTMYNPKMPPNVSHFTGTDLIVNHIEKYVCPTITSSQVLDEVSFKFKKDVRPKIVFMIGEREYLTAKTLPAYADLNLLKKYRLEYLFAEDGKSDFGDVKNALSDADLLFLSVRRRALNNGDMSVVKKFINDGKPVIGIRTSSHAFSLRGKAPPKGYKLWEEFDQQVFGGNYTNHYGNEFLAIANVCEIDHPILEGVAAKSFDTGGSLYKVMPLKDTTTVLLNGIAPKANASQPLAWINKNKFGGYSFYTSLGHSKDFKNPQFQRILNNAVDWLLNGLIKKNDIQRNKTLKKKSIHESVDGALSPEKSHSLIKTTDGIEVDLLLSEPYITQPLHLSFDYKGRLWVVQYSQYPDPAGLKRLSRDKVWRVSYDKVPPPPPHKKNSTFWGNDKISIHEDTNGDGRYDTHKVFLDGLNMATSVAHDGKGVWVTNPPYLLYYEDQNQDDVPDGDPIVHLEGFGLEDSHSIANSLVLGVDGWIYGAQGSTVSASVKSVMSKNKIDPVNSMGQNIWRYNPQNNKYQIFAEGGGNAFGVEIDSRGRIFSGHNGGDTRGFHYVKGAYYRKSWGKHGALTNPFAYGYFPAMENAQVERFTHQFIIYEGNGMPDRFNGRLLGVDVLHNNLVMSEITPNGATFKTKDVERFITSDDPWFRPVMVTDAPDGSLYIADWYDKQVNHYRNHEGQIDKKLGRIYRIRNENFEPKKKINYRQLNEADLINLLDSNSRWERKTALQQIKLRYGFNGVEKTWSDNPKNKSQFEYIIGSNKNIILEKISDPGIKGYALRRLSEENRYTKYTEQIISISINEKNAEVVSQLISSLSGVELSLRNKLIENILLRDEFSSDPFIPLQLWWSLESAITEDDSIIKRLFSGDKIWTSRIVNECILGRITRRLSAEQTIRAYELCGYLLNRAPNNISKKELIDGFINTNQLSDYRSLPKVLLDAFDDNNKLLPIDLRLRIGGHLALDEAIKYLNKNKTNVKEKARLISILPTIKNDKVYRFLLNYLDLNKDPIIEVAMLSSLSSYIENIRFQNAVFKKLSDKEQLVREAALELLISNANSASFLIDKIYSGEFKFPLNNLSIIEKLQTHESARIKKFISELSIPDMKISNVHEGEINRIKKIIHNGGGNPKLGESIFKSRCSGCHKMFNEGGQIGPDLTSYQKNDQDTLLLSLIAPSAEIREGYENIIIKTKDGLVHSGFLLEETKDQTTFRELNGTTKLISNLKIEFKKFTGASLMPSGLLNGLSDAQLKDFFAYLRSTTPPF